jgi:DNA-binding transcriptional LysR family regulator
MNVGLRQLRAFLAVAKCGSFGRAAEEVAVSQSAVSFAVQQLENELGLRLLDRTTRQVRVTAVGETLAASATRLLAELDTVLRELKDTGRCCRKRSCRKQLLVCLLSRGPGVTATGERIARIAMHLRNRRAHLTCWRAE